MKSTFTVTLCLLLMVPVVGSFTKEAKPLQGLRVTREVSFTLETLTVYNPVKSQCDRTPLITASNARIDVKKLQNKEIRWMALSRNLLKRWNGQFHYGDTVMVSAGDPEIDGLWVIQDNLNKRYKNRGDLLFHSAVKSTGKWKNVKISRFEDVIIEAPVQSSPEELASSSEVTAESSSI